MEENKDTNLTNTKVGTPPVGYMANQYIYHLGIILSNLSIVFLILSATGILSFFMPILYWCLLIMITVYSIGTIFLFYPGFTSWWGVGLDMYTITKPIIDLFPLFIILTFASTIASLVLLLINKNRRNTTRIAFSCILLGLAVAVVIGVLVGGLS